MTGKDKVMEKSMSDVFRTILQVNVGAHENTDLMLQKWQFIITLDNMYMTISFNNAKITLLLIV